MVGTVITGRKIEDDKGLYLIVMQFKLTSNIIVINPITQYIYLL